VQKIISMLGELKSKVAADLEAEAKAMDEYSSYCDDESKEKGFAITTASSEIEDLSASIEGSTCKITEYTSTVDTSGTEMAEKQGELDDARKVMEKKHKIFLENEKELTDCVDTLGRAATVLERELSFMQGKASPKQLNQKLGPMVTALSAIVEAEWVDEASKQKLESFLRSNGNQVEEDDLSLVQQPQASVKSYESKSGGIVDTLKDMQDKAEDQLNELNKDSLKTRGEFNVLEQTLTDSIANLDEQIKEASSSKCAAEEAKAKCEKDKAATEESKSADEE